MTQSKQTRLFRIGTVVSTQGALDLLHAHNQSPFHFLALHQSGDWGVVPPEDASANESALTNGARLMSAYFLGDDCLWIVTEADRSSTTLMLPDEY